MPLGTIVHFPHLPSSPASTPPTSPSSPIIIPDYPTPPPKKNLEDHSKTVIDLTVFERLASITHKTAIPKPKPSEPSPDVGTSLLTFETEVDHFSEAS